MHSPDDVMYQVPVPECPEETGTPRPAERQAISSSLSFCHFTIHPAHSNLIISSLAYIFAPTLHSHILIHFIYCSDLVPVLCSTGYYILRKGKAHACTKNEV
jgi:hypothetical protein